MKCIFCGKEIPKGKGIMYIKKDGKLFNFCNTKCKKNNLTLKRSPTKTRWTNFAHQEKERLKKAREKKKNTKTKTDSVSTVKPSKLSDSEVSETSK